MRSLRGWAFLILIAEASAQDAPASAQVEPTSPPVAPAGVFTMLRTLEAGCAAPGVGEDGDGALAPLYAQAADCAELARKIADVERVVPQSEVQRLRALQEQKSDEVARKLPGVPLGGDWSLTVPVYVGLVRAGIGDSERGEVDTFTALSGVGSGIKFRLQHVPTDGEPFELLGFSIGAYFEPQLKVQGRDSSAQALSATALVSTFQAFSLGLGYTVFSNVPGFSRARAGNNVFVIFGIGADGATLSDVGP